MISLNANPKEEGLTLLDSTKQAVGFLGSQIYYDPDEVNKGFAKINIGIEKYPDRLDMRFGKIYTLGQVERWEDFTNEIIKTVNYSNENNNAWEWSNK